MGSYVGTEGWSRKGRSETKRSGAGPNGGHVHGYGGEATSQDGIIEMERRDGLRGTDATAADEPVYVPHAQASHAV